MVTIETNKTHAAQKLANDLPGYYTKLCDGQHVRALPTESWVDVEYIECEACLRLIEQGYRRGRKAPKAGG